MTTMESTSFTFDPRDMLLSFHIGFSLRAAVAWSVLQRATVFDPPSKTIAPMYLKPVTVPSLCPLTLTSLWVALTLFAIGLVLSAPAPL